MGVSEHEIWFFGSSESFEVLETARRSGELGVKIVMLSTQAELAALSRGCVIVEWSRVEIELASSELLAVFGVYDDHVMMSPGFIPCAQNTLATMKSAIASPCFLWNIVQILERKLAFSSTTNKVLLFEKFFDVNPDAIVFANASREIVLVNRAFTDMFGYTLDEIRGQTTACLYAAEGAYERAGKERFNPRAGEQRDIYWVDYVRKSGERFPATTVGVPVRGATGELHGFLGVIADMTEQVAYENQLEEQTTRLQQHADVLANFAYITSHDLRSPVHGIRQLAEWILEDTPEHDGELEAHTGLILSRVELIEQMLSSLRAFVRAAQYDGVFDEIDIERSIAALVQRVAGEREVSFSCDGAPVVLLPREPFARILFEVISNAIEHHDRDACRIDVHVDEREDAYVITVTDDGPGVHGEELDAIRGNLSQSARKKRWAGLGAGLLNANHILSAAGGDIRCESPVSTMRGARFEITWPRRFTALDLP